MAPSATRVGVVHVMERLSRHQGFLPLRNALVQFFDLLELPGMRKDVARIDARATVEEAQRMLNSESVEALCVQRMNAPAILGVITQEDIDNYREVS